MRQSGLADLLPSLRAVYVGVSAGSIVMAPRIGERFVSWKPPAGDGDGEKALGLVDFAMFPHLDDEDLPAKTMAHAEEWAASVPVPGYATDEQTAIKVIDGAVEVVSEGHWKLFPATRSRSRPGGIGEQQ
jgi:dipeptidase E